MPLFRKPKTKEDLASEQRYEAAKERLMHLHRVATDLFYIDEVLYAEAGTPPQLIGEIAKGDIQAGDVLQIYDCEANYVADMEVAELETKEENHFLQGKLIQIVCTPRRYSKHYVPGQFLARIKELNSEE